MPNKPYFIEVDPSRDAKIVLALEAAHRGIDVNALVLQIVETIVQDRLLNAVLEE